MVDDGRIADAKTIMLLPVGRPARPVQELTRSFASRM